MRALSIRSAHWRDKVIFIRWRSRSYPSWRPYCQGATRPEQTLTGAIADTDDVTVHGHLVNLAFHDFQETARKRLEKIYARL